MRTWKEQYFAITIYDLLSFEQNSQKNNKRSPNPKADEQVSKTWKLQWILYTLSTLDSTDEEKQCWILFSVF